MIRAIVAFAKANIALDQAQAAWTKAAEEHVSIDQAAVLLDLAENEFHEASIRLGDALSKHEKLVRIILEAYESQH